jgi:hypothetical protein
LVCTAATIFLMQPVPTGRWQDTFFHREVSLVLFSTFEPVSLTPDSCMQKNGIPMVYERDTSQLPTLYVCTVENVLGLAPIFLCCLKGNLHKTIPCCLRHHVLAGSAADSRQDSGTGSRLFDVNIWMWRYGRALPRTISVKFAEEMRRERV